VGHRSAGGDEPSSLARLTVKLEPLSPGELSDIEQPSSLAKLSVKLVKLESLSASEPAEIEQPSSLAEWSVTLEPLAPWDELPGSFPAGER
jgi:hypothetical protein